MSPYVHNVHNKQTYSLNTAVMGSIDSADSYDDWLFWCGNKFKNQSPAVWPLLFSMVCFITFTTRKKVVAPFWFDSWFYYSYDMEYGGRFGCGLVEGDLELDTLYTITFTEGIEGNKQRDDDMYIVYIWHWYWFWILVFAFLDSEVNRILYMYTGIVG